MANYPLQYKTEIAIQRPTLVVEPVRAPNIVHCHKWVRTLHIFMWVWVHVGNVGVRDGVKIALNAILQFLNSQHYK